MREKWIQFRVKGPWPGYPYSRSPELCPKGREPVVGSRVQAISLVIFREP